VVATATLQPNSYGLCGLPLLNDMLPNKARQYLIHYVTRLPGTADPANEYKRWVAIIP
jgi:hypothetical protein